MKSNKLRITGCLLALTCLSSGCESMSNTAKGGLIGGGLGAGLGAAAGGGKGALIGGLAGTVVGGAVGNDMDQQEKRQLQQRAAIAEARPVQPPLGVTEVINMTKEGMSDGVIITQIRSTRSTFQLSNGDLSLLQANRVSQNVIIEMQNRPAGGQVIYTRPQPVYVESYPPPPPVYGGAVYIRR